MVFLAPLGDRVAVEVLSPDSVSAGGVIIPDTAGEASQQGRVIAIGSGSEVGDLGLAVGDTVLFVKSAGHKVSLRDGEVLVLRHFDVLAVLSEGSGPADSEQVVSLDDVRAAKKVQ